MRCRLKITVQSGHCMQGFGKLLKHSTVSGFNLESEDVYKLTKEQYKNAHDLNQISLTSGTKELTLKTSRLGRQDSISVIHGEVFSNHTCIGAKAGEKLYLSPKRAREDGYGKVVKIRLDLTLDIEKFKLDLASNMAIFPCMGI